MRVPEHHDHRVGGHESLHGIGRGRTVFTNVPGLVDGLHRFSVAAAVFNPMQEIRRGQYAHAAAVVIHNGCATDAGT